MQTNTISAGYNTAYSLGTGSKEVKNGEGFADALQGISKKAPTITSSEGLTLRYRKDYVADDGSKCLTSWVDARTAEAARLSMFANITSPYVEEPNDE